jgi:hypothetical protein
MSDFELRGLGVNREEVVTFQGDLKSCAQQIILMMKMRGRKRQCRVGNDCGASIVRVRVGGRG